MKRLSNVVLLLIASSFMEGCSSFHPFRAGTPMNATFEEAPVVRPFYDNYWLLMNDLKFTAIRQKDKKKFEIIVPAGFVTDLASIPVGLNLIYDKTGRYSSAGILHDYLYWTQSCSRNTSDRLIKEGLKATGSGYFTRNSIKIGVKLFGWAAWESNAAARRNGEERFVPKENQVFSSNTKWDCYKDNINKESPPWASLYRNNANLTKPDYCLIFADEE